MFHSEQEQNNYIDKTKDDSNISSFKYSDHKESEQNYNNNYNKSINNIKNKTKPFLAKVTSINSTIDELQKAREFHANNYTIHNALVNYELLFVEQNDVVTIEEGLDEHWFVAKSDQHQGILASKCFQLLDDQIPSLLCKYLIDNQFYNLHVCFASFVAQDVGDLSITKGDIIVANNQVNEHWLNGQVCFDSQANSWPKLVASQQVGTFPLNHCWQLDSERVKAFCHDKICQLKSQELQCKPIVPPLRPSFNLLTTHSSSLSSGSSSVHSFDYLNNQKNNINNNNLQIIATKPPIRPEQPPKQLNKIQSNQQQTSTESKAPSLLFTSKQQDKLKGWLHTVKKKTARLSTRITASLGLISLTRDEEFEKHYENFKHIEKTIRVFIKNLSSFVEHFENFLLALQHTSENLSDFYRDKSHQKELEELRRKNKALNCEHFHAFKRTIDRQVITVANQLLQKFSGPHQLITKRSAKLLDYDTRTKEMDSCRDLEKKAALRDQYVIAKDLYDRINRQLIEELPLFNQFAIDIFRECVLVLLDGRKNLIQSYTKQTANLLDTPLMLTYTASDVASSILMSCDLAKNYQMKKNTEINELIEKGRKDSGQTSGHGTRHNSANDDETSRPHSSASQLSSEFDQMAIAAREISSTPLSQFSEPAQPPLPPVNSGIGPGSVRFDEADGGAITDVGFVENTEPTESQPHCSASATNQSDDGFESVKKEYQSIKKGEIKKRKKKFHIYVASWPFVSTGPNQLTISCKQPLKLIKGCDECGNTDWSLVQDKKGQLGYVPSSYIKKKE